MAKLLAWLRNRFIGGVPEIVQFRSGKYGVRVMERDWVFFGILGYFFLLDNGRPSMIHDEAVETTEEGAHRRMQMYYELRGRAREKEAMRNDIGRRVK